MRALAIVASTALLATVAGAATPTTKGCETGVSVALTSCINSVQKSLRKCRLNPLACTAANAAVTKARGKLGPAIQAKCDLTTIHAASYGDAIASTQQLVDRVDAECVHAATALSARAYGGPHGATFQAADATTRKCLDTAFLQGAKLQTTLLKTYGACIKKAHAGGTCDVAKLGTTVSQLLSKAAVATNKKCLDATAHDMLAPHVGLDANQFAANTAAVARCSTATAWGDVGPVPLDCGPRGLSAASRGDWVKITLPQATWGSKCGDGTDYAFWLRLAPSGAPLGKVVTDMQGGGVCLGDSDCSTRPADLFSAADEGQPDGGYLSTDPLINPFFDRTMLFLPYCTQDVHIGGGNLSGTTFPVYRYGAINVRAAISYLRDVLWEAMNADEPGGYQPENLEVFFAGESAGGFGVQYNYHWMLDDLGWPQTLSVPDSALALDAPPPAALHISLLGILIAGGGSGGWNARPMLPPYCQGTDCGVGPIIQSATSPRLTGRFQGFLNLSNQHDEVQIGTTFFPDEVTWANTLRTSYCAQKGKQGIHYFLPAEDTAIHTMLRTNSLFTTLDADGVSVRDYVAAAMASPETIVDRVDEGDLVTAFPGVNAFTCLP